ncbi:MAG: hypothetical protein D6731_10355 [Planctomycetota bacterium]|nr:MAG: hypothetical protein D6731_10355 [Planctomycetota bacterium]
MSGQRAEGLRSLRPSAPRRDLARLGAGALLRYGDGQPVRRCAFWAGLAGLFVFFLVCIANPPFDYVFLWAGGYVFLCAAGTGAGVGLAVRAARRLRPESACLLVRRPPAATPPRPVGLVLDLVVAGLYGVAGATWLFAFSLLFFGPRRLAHRLDALAESILPGLGAWHPVLSPYAGACLGLTLVALALRWHGAGAKGLRRGDRAGLAFAGFSAGFVAPIAILSLAAEL